MVKPFENYILSPEQKVFLRKVTNPFSSFFLLFWTRFVLFFQLSLPKLFKLVAILFQFSLKFGFNRVVDIGIDSFVYFV